MANKRSFQQDPEYDVIPAEIQEKQMKLIEDDARQSTKKKIEAVIKSNFEQEISDKDAEIDNIDDVLHEARLMLDRLRACIITKYYATLGLEQPINDSSGPSIHPTSKNYLGKTPKYFSESITVPTNTPENVLNNTSRISEASSSSTTPAVNTFNLEKMKSKLCSTTSELTLKTPGVQSYLPRFKTKCKIVIGNVSKFIPIWRREENDQSTHKWMVYVRGDKNNPNIDSFVKKVRFLLHPSYRPNDVIEVSQSPFHLIKRGWGEFPVRVQLHFHDTRNKPVDIIHQLKLDKTFTGLQTLGAETVAELQLYKVVEHNQEVFVSNETSTITPGQSSVSENQVESSSENCTELINSCNGVNSVKDIASSTEVILPNVIRSKKCNDISEKGKNFTFQGLGNGNKVSILRFPNVHKTALPTVVSGSLSSSLNLATGVLPKIATSSNGISRFVKCTDSEGRLLLVPQSSLVCVKANKIETPKHQILTNSSISNEKKSIQTKSLQSNSSSVPSYILKVVSNQESGQNQVLLIPMSEKIQKSQELSESSVKSLPTVNGMPEKVSSRKEEISGKKLKVASFFENEINKINLEYYKSHDELLKRVANFYPLFKEGIDRTVFPFCASSLEEYLSWNIGKQRASEWQRAGTIKTTLFNILSKKSKTCLKAEEIWSRKAIMLWCRKYGFTPMTTGRTLQLPEPTWSGEELCSLNDAFDLISTLKEEKPTITQEEEVDIMEIEEKQNIPIKSSGMNHPKFHLPYLREAASYVKETASRISVHLKPVEAEPSMYMPIVEEMILSACMELASDLTCNAVSEGFKRMGGKICPEEITISDVYSAVKKSQKFDFLTNSCLGIPKESIENT